MSLKDQFHVKGVDTTMGYVGWIGRNLGIGDPKDTHKVESQITKELLHQGAVLCCEVCFSLHAIDSLEELTDPYTRPVYLRPCL